MDREKLKNLIRLRFPDGYKSGMDLTIDDVCGMDPEVQRRTLKFLETGEIEDVEIESYTIEKLTKMGMNALAAFLSQDWLLRNPGEAKAMLKRGWDSIKFPNEKKKSENT
jgi:hypothetical protein